MTDNCISSAGRASVHVFQPSSGLATTPLPKTVGVCVAPQGGVEDTTYSALESVLLNGHFGVRHFLLYDRGLTSKFFAQLDRAKMISDLNVSSTSALNSSIYWVRVVFETKFL